MPGLALGQHFLRFNELASHMHHARQPLHARLQRQGVIACVIIGHYIAAITFQQAQWYFLRTAVQMSWNPQRRYNISVLLLLPLTA